MIPHGARSDLYLGNHFNIGFGNHYSSQNYNLDDGGDGGDDEEFRLLAERQSCESGSPSPPLWKNTAFSVTKSADNSPVHSGNHYEHDQHHHYNLGRQVYSTVRAQQIARSRQEMLSMVRDMPENDYELSLRDMVQPQPSPRIARVDQPSPRISRADDEVVVKEREVSKEKERKNVVSSGNLKRFPRNEKVESGGFLLKMFTPMSFVRGRKKKSLGPSSSAKVSPRSSFSENAGVLVGQRASYSEGEKGRMYSSDNEWWRRSDSGGKGNSSSSGSSGSSSSGGSANQSRKLFNCYSFLHRSKPME